jgi:hypothetical protein
MCNHYLDDWNKCRVCNMIRFLCMQKRGKLATLPRDINKIIFEFTKLYELHLFIVENKVDVFESLRFKPPPERSLEFKTPERLDIKYTPFKIEFWGTKESFIGFQAYIYSAFSRGDASKDLQKRLAREDDVIALYCSKECRYLFKSPNYPEFVSGMIIAMRISCGLSSIDNRMNHMMYGNQIPKIIKYYDIEKTAIQQLTAIHGDNFDRVDIFELKRKLGDENITITWGYVRNVQKSFPCQFSYLRLPEF